MTIPQFFEKLEEFEFETANILIDEYEIDTGGLEEILKEKFLEVLKENQKKIIEDIVKHLYQSHSDENEEST